MMYLEDVSRKSIAVLDALEKECFNAEIVVTVICKNSVRKTGPFSIKNFSLCRYTEVIDFLVDKGFISKCDDSFVLTDKFFETFSSTLDFWWPINQELAS